MSDQTRGAWDRASATAEEARVTSDRIEQELLHHIAVGIPARVDAIAKRAAEREPDVTRHLGSEGIRAMRAELAQAASALADDIRAAATQITWPAEEALRYGEVRTRQLDAALFGYLHGPRMESIADVLQTHGYAIYGDGTQRTQDVVNPHDFYSEQWLAPLAEARTNLSLAQGRVGDAKTVDDQASVRSIWDGS
jgi:hypothetical protein